MKFKKRDKAVLADLLSVCKNNSGEYLPSHHSINSWATTYSTDFLDASAELYLLIEKSRSSDVLYDMMRIYNYNNIRSCRGGRFNISKVNYLYDSHLKWRISEKRNTQRSGSFQKQTCPYCSKIKTNVLLHVSKVHPELWEDYISRQDVTVGNIKRCTNCGDFISKIPHSNCKRVD